MQVNIWMRGKWRLSQSSLIFENQITANFLSFKIIPSSVCYVYNVETCVIKLNVLIFRPYLNYYNSTSSCQHKFPKVNPKIETFN